MPSIEIPTTTTLNNVGSTPNARAMPTSEAEVHASTYPAPTTAEKHLALESNIMAPPAKRAHVESTTLNFVNSVTLAVGAAFVVPKATRKKRSDAGVTCSPQKQRTPPTSKNAGPAEMASRVAAPKPHAHKKAAPEVTTATAGSSSSSP